MELFIKCVNETESVGISHSPFITLNLPSMTCKVEDSKKYRDELFRQVQSSLGAYDFSEMVVHEGHYRRDCLFIVQYLLCRVRAGKRQVKMNASMLAWMMRQQIQEVRDEYENERLQYKALFSHVTKGEN